MLDWFYSLDGGLLLWIQDTLRNAVLDPILCAYTSLGNVGQLFLATAVLLLIFPKTRKAGWAALLSIGLGFICTNLVLKHWIARPRPWLDVPGLVALVAEHDPNSFPSGHTCAAFAAAGAWCRALPRRWMKVLSVALAALMGLSRLYVGVHFPTDVIAGCAVGLCSGWLAWRLGERFLPEREAGGPR